MQFLWNRKEAVGEGADRHTRGRVCSPELFMPSLGSAQKQVPDKGRDSDIFKRKTMSDFLNRTRSAQDALPTSGCRIRVFSARLSAQSKPFAGR
jgi:hypothetical protein